MHVSDLLKFPLLPNDRNQEPFGVLDTTNVSLFRVAEWSFCIFSSALPTMGQGHTAAMLRLDAPVEGLPFFLVCPGFVQTAKGQS